MNRRKHTKHQKQQHAFFFLMVPLLKQQQGKTNKTTPPISPENPELISEQDRRYLGYHPTHPKKGA